MRYRSSEKIQRKNFCLGYFRKSLSFVDPIAEGKVIAGFY
jgi:hypothetical protein